jgi:GntR family transcriptional regulator
LTAPTKSTSPAPRRPTLADEAERVLRDWLASGGHRKGDRLPPEHDLATRLDISRGTLRLALQRLERSGDVVRRQGSGTFVGEIKELLPFSEGLERLAPYTRLARARAIELRATAIEIEREPLEDDVAVLFDVEPGTAATHCRRVLLADGEPVAVMSDFIHPDVDLPSDPELMRVLRRGAMLLDVLLEREVPIAYSQTRIRARTIVPGDELGTALAVTEPTALLELEETVHQRDGTVAQRSTDLFGPGAIDLHVIRHLDRELLEPVPRAPGG